MKILVVDDDFGMCETLTDILEEEGHDVVTAHDGCRAVDETERRSFDAVVMDIRMPGMNGVEACKIMRRENPNLRVVLMTAYAVESLVCEALKEHGVRVLSKPLDIEKTLELLERNTWS